MKKSIAGHDFADNHIDSQCVKLKEGEPCRATRAFLFQAVFEDVNQLGIAHMAQLTNFEYNEIVAERELYQKHCDAVMEAVRLVASG
jgi:hypothetical protein